MSIELETVAGASCVHCNERILVAVDGRNCGRCGRAVHKGACGKAHKGACAGPTEAAQHTPRDYDEAAPFVFDAKATAAFALPAFVASFGVQRLVGGPEGELASAASARLQQGGAALAVALAGFAAAYFWTKGRQR